MCNPKLPVTDIPRVTVITLGIKYITLGIKYITLGIKNNPQDK